jgi:hypothetical protein
VRTILFALPLAVGLSGCDFGVPDISSVPANPTFDADVKPLLDDHCNLCHGKNESYGAPGNFRLDVYDNVGSTAGAKAMARSIVEEVDEDSMPPAAEWGDGMGPNGKKLLKRWVEQGSPEN